MAMGLDAVVEPEFEDIVNVSLMAKWLVEVNNNLKRLALPRLINIAIGLTVASLIAAFGAPLLPEPHHIYGLVSAYEFATDLAAYLFLAALFAWALVILAAIIRWNSDFPGY